MSCRPNNDGVCQCASHRSLVTSACFCHVAQCLTFLVKTVPALVARLGHPVVLIEQIEHTKHRIRIYRVALDGSVHDRDGFGVVERGVGGIVPLRT